MALGQPHSEIAGRNVSEPMSSLVNELEKPTLWSKGEGRWAGAVKTEVAHVDSRGSKDGMFMEDLLPSAGDPFRGWGDHRLLRIRKRKRSGPRRESEGFIVPFESEGQHNPGRGKEPCFVRATEGRRIRGLPCC